MWLKWPGTFCRHFSQSARYPILNVFFMPGTSCVQPCSVCRLRVCPFLGDGATGGSISMEFTLGAQSVLHVLPECVDPEAVLPVTSLTVLRALGVRGGAAKSMADAALGGMPWCSWLSSTILGEPKSSPPVSLIGEGRRRFCTKFQSVMAFWSTDRGIERSGVGRAKALGRITFPAAPPQLFPRTCAAKEQWIGVGILLVIPPGCTASGCNRPGPKWLEGCACAPLSAPSISMSISTSVIW